MKEILKNLALIDLTNFCKENGIECFGSHCVKVGRGFTFALQDDDTGINIVFVTFHKNSVPTHMINRDYWRVK